MVLVIVRSDSHPLHGLPYPCNEAPLRVNALRGERVQFRALVCFPLYERVRDHPFKVLYEPWIVEAYPHLQIRLFHPSTILIQRVKETGENVKVRALQTRSQAVEKIFLRILVSPLFPLVLSERLEPEVEIHDNPGQRSNRGALASQGDKGEG